MVRRVKNLSNSRNRLDLLVTQEPFELLPDHLHTLPYRIGVLVGVLQRQPKITQHWNKPPQDILFPTAGRLQPFLGHTSAVVLKISLQTLQLIEILLGLPALFG
jgi:hypothetical protein